MKDKDTQLIWESYNSNLNETMTPKPANDWEKGKLMGMQTQQQQQPQQVKFDFPYTNGSGGAPRPEFVQQHSTVEGSFYIQQFGPQAATKPITYKNHNPLGNELAPGKFYEVHINWSWDGDNDPGDLYSPPTETYIDDVQIEQIQDEDGNDIPESDVIWKHAQHLIDQSLQGAGQSDMEAYGWEPESDY